MYSLGPLSLLCGLIPAPHTFQVKALLVTVRMGWTFQMMQDYINVNFASAI
jgi:hypothetical protein